MKKLIPVLCIIMFMLPLLADEPLELREVGTWTGYVYNTETDLPVEDAIVYLSPHFPNSPAEYYNCWTNENGYFEFVDIVAAVYDVKIVTWFYYDHNTTITINEGINDPTDYLIQRATGCNMTILFAPDDYYYESSWSLKHVDTNLWYNTAPVSFDSDVSVREFFFLNEGTWRLYLYDSYGDGGLRAYCSNEDGNVQFDQTGSGSTYTIDFYVPAEPGNLCDNSISYGNINDPQVFDDCHGRQFIWYELTLDNSYSDVTVSLMNSTFDTQLEVWDDCTAGSYLAYNDNWNGFPQSQIVFGSLSAGTYYIKIYSIDEEVSGYYDLEVTGNFAIMYGDVDDNGIVEAYDAATILQYVVELDPDAVPLPWDESTIIRANVDGNEDIGAFDASLVMQYVAGIITSFPVE